ncbi:MAG: 30S ribosomal protein S3 [Alphaproteobacteria bacterium]|nr:30S ribosomal protein S3 [Alphaproteobacteria bacterium]
MGQKVNPVGFRLLNNKNWESVWYDRKNYSKKLISDVIIRSFIKKNYAHCGIGSIIIERPSDKINLVIKTSKPGVLIGKKGLDIEKINQSVEKIAGTKVEVKIVEIDKPDINSSLVAQSIAKQLEGRAAFKKAMKKAMQSATKFGALGIKVSCAGRLGGAEIARTEWYKEGSVPLHTLRCNIDYATANAYTGYGVIGVKVWIYKGFVEKKKISTL